MSPIETFNWIFFKYMSLPCRFSGLKIFDPKLKFTIATLANISGAFSFLVCFIWMLCTRDMMTIIKASTCMGLCMQGLTKFFTHYIQHIRFYEIVEFLRHLYLMNTFADLPNYHILQRWSRYMKILCHFFILLTVFMSCVLFTAPAVQFWLTGKSDTFLPVFLPLVDETKPVGYAFTNMYLGYMMTLGLIGSLASDSVQIMFVLHMWPMTLMFAHMIRQMNAAVMNDEIRHSVELRGFFRNILMMHQQIYRYNRIIADLYYALSTVEVYSNTFGLCTCMFCFFSADWPPVGILIVMQIAKLLAVCFLGTIAELASDHLLDGLTASNWYLLPVDEQKKFLLMMSSAQRPIVLSAGVLPLNLNLFVNLMKTVYTVTMLLSETIN